MAVGQPAAPRTRTPPSARSARAWRATSAAAPATTTSCARCSPRRRSGWRRSMIPAAFDYVRAGVGRPRRCRPAGRARRRRQAAGRRPFAAADDEAAPGQSRGAHRHRAASPSCPTSASRRRRRRHRRRHPARRHRRDSDAARPRRRCCRTWPALVGDPQIRHRGTIGGSLAHADPAADLPTAVLALGATLVVTGPAGPREVQRRRLLHRLLRDRARHRTSCSPRSGCRAGRPGALGYEKFIRRANDWAIVAVAAVRRPGRAGQHGPDPAARPRTEQALAGGASIAEAAALAD